MDRRRLLQTASLCLGGSVAGCLDAISVEDREPPQSERAAPRRSASPSTESDVQNRTAGYRATPEYDCELARRPPAPSAESDARNRPEKFTYPRRPTTLSDRATVIEYAKQYERAYRANALRAKYGEDLLTVNVGVEKVWTHQAPEGAAVVRFRYSYWFEYEHTDGPTAEPVHGDSGDIYVSYYIDDSVVIRAAKDGQQEVESDLDPDPWEDGTPLECF